MGAKRMSAWRKNDKTELLSDSGRKLCIPPLFCYTVSDRIPPVCNSEGRDAAPSARRMQMRFGDSVSGETWL